MTSTILNRVLAGAALVAVLLGVAQAAWRDGDIYVVGDVELWAAQPDPTVLRLDFSFAPPWADDYAAPAGVDAVTSRVGEIEFGEAGLESYPTGGDTTAVLFLIDTSNPARQRVVRRNVEDILEMTAHAGEHHLLGLGTVDEDLEIVAPLGTDRAALVAAADGIGAAGLRTELIRLGTRAVEMLAGTEADRRALFIFSDGKAEDDPAVFPVHELSDAAIAAGVRIYTFGYDTDQENNFGVLRRLSRDTGGDFFRADPGLALPADVLAHPFDWLDSGGRAVIDLAAAVDAALGGDQIFQVTLVTNDERRLDFEIAVTLPPVEAQAYLSNLWDTVVAFVSDTDNLPWTIAAGVGIAVVLALLVWALVALAQHRRRRRRAKAAATAPIAHLEFLDSSGSRIPMVGRYLKIGRNPDNDVRLTNHTVSAYHADIHQKRDGSFVITDLDSLNGVMVNEEVVETKSLENGDEIDIGEVRFRFVLAQET